MNNNTLDGNNTSVLFSPIKIRGVNFPNRIAMGPMTVTQATADGQVTDFLVEWYRRRAAAHHVRPTPGTPTLWTTAS